MGVTSIDGLPLDDIEAALHQIQDEICARVQSLDPQGSFKEDAWVRAQGGGGRTRIFEGGSIIEKGGVNFSRVLGERLPSSATAKNEKLVGRGFEAMGVSVVLHPQNPFVPTSHMNIRVFVATSPNEDPIWWFGGGFDLTPYYVFEEDCRLWHQEAKKVCDTLEPGRYQKYKEWCDTYFFLKHRNETRGVGGLFFDDLNDYDAPTCFQFIQNVGRCYAATFSEIVSKRASIPYEQRHRDFQAYRRGRYVEFNLVYDRGTIFGLQTGGRIESILMSMPPVAHWVYQYEPQPNSLEEELLQYLKPQNWIS